MGRNRLACLSNDIDCVAMREMTNRLNTIVRVALMMVAFAGSANP